MAGEVRIERSYLPDREREMRALLVLLGTTSTSTTTLRPSRHASGGAELDADPGHGRRLG